MRKVIKNMVLALLVALARIRVRRLRPFIIGVTGSVGKTSTKEAIFAVLKSRYSVLRSEKSYNTEFGLPLAILEQKSGFSSPSKWVKTLIGAVWNAFFGGRHLQIFVIEMGVDKPGDMDFLLKIIKPQVGVMTAIKPVHLGERQFKDLDDIFLEKKKLVESLPEMGTAVLNLDDPYISSLRGKLRCREFFYGTHPDAELRAAEISQTVSGISFSVSYRGETASVSAPLIGMFNVYVLLPAIANSLLQGFSLAEACEKMGDYRLPPGRMNLIAGVKDSMLIDSSYNASPEAVKMALSILSDFTGRRIAVLGNMNELGEISEVKHREVGKFTVGRTDILVTIGEMADWIRLESLKEGFKAENCFSFPDASTAGDFLAKMVAKGDTILVKGSQNSVRLERVVKKLMKNPEEADRLLVRQDDSWL